ncbi:MAG: hypothetical protein LBH50_04350 [Spirochaetaceae bacterium]|jgi:hypothetical protein|nr:hypothetical protein [Spirochaetaceae bacterium]
MTAIKGVCGRKLAAIGETDKNAVVKSGIPFKQLPTSAFGGMGAFAR